MKNNPKNTAQEKIIILLIKSSKIVESIKKIVHDTKNKRISKNYSTYPVSLVYRIFTTTFNR